MRNLLAEPSTVSPHTGSTGAPSGVIARPALTQRLSAALDRGSVFLIAPAGAGKTMVLEEMLAGRDGDVARVRCTVADRHAGRLLDQVVGAVRMAVPGAADVLGDRLAGALGHVSPGATLRELVDRTRAPADRPAHARLRRCRARRRRCRGCRHRGRADRERERGAARGGRLAPAAAAANGEVASERAADGDRRRRPRVQRGRVRRVAAAQLAATTCPTPRCMRCWSSPRDGRSGSRSRSAPSGRAAGSPPRLGRRPNCRRSCWRRCSTAWTARSGRNCSGRVCRPSSRLGSRRRSAWTSSSWRLRSSATSSCARFAVEPRSGSAGLPITRCSAISSSSACGANSGGTSCGSCMPTWRQRSATNARWRRSSTGWSQAARRKRCGSPGATASRWCAALPPSCATGSAGCRPLRARSRPCSCWRGSWRWARGGPRTRSRSCAPPRRRGSAAAAARSGPPASRSRRP